MSNEIYYLVVTAITISCLHTITGPDHYLPFIALAKTKNWTLHQTITWTLLCGAGHVAGSLLLGIGGIAFGLSLSKITWLENVRGGAAAWAMLLLGTAYLLYAVYQLSTNKRHKHFEGYDDGALYVYEHKHGSVVYPNERRKVTPWVMFVVFVLGPCEPLIPLLSFPAARQSVTGVVVLVSVFTIFTLACMVAMVLLGYYGVAFFKTEKLERYVHVIGGSTVMICGTGMVFMGW